MLYFRLHDGPFAWFNTLVAVHELKALQLLLPVLFVSLSPNMANDASTRTC